jgi:hypothetical protein
MPAFDSTLGGYQQTPCSVPGHRCGASLVAGVMLFLIGFEVLGVWDDKTFLVDESHSLYLYIIKQAGES